MKRVLVLRSSVIRLFDFVLAPGLHIVGRSRECEFRVDYGTISRRHARLEVHGEELTLTDLGSRNGSFVDERRVATSRLHLGQLVRFGSVGFAVAIENNQEVQDAKEVFEDATDPLEEDAGFAGPDSLMIQLSFKQRRVFDLLVNGQTEKQIARDLDLSIHTVNSHTRAVFRLFSVNSRPRLLARIFGGAKSRHCG